MIDQRILILVVAPVIVLYCVYALNHRDLSVKRDPTLKVGRFVGALAGSKNEFVNAPAFGMQLGYTTIILWYLLMLSSSIDYLRDNVYVLSIIFGTSTGVILAKVLSRISRKS